MFKFRRSFPHFYRPNKIDYYFVFRKWIFPVITELFFLSIIFSLLFLPENNWTLALIITSVAAFLTIFLTFNYLIYESWFFQVNFFTFALVYFWINNFGFEFNKAYFSLQIALLSFLSLVGQISIFRWAKKFSRRKAQFALYLKKNMGKLLGYFSSFFCLYLATIGFILFFSFLLFATESNSLVFSPKNDWFLQIVVWTAGFSALIGISQIVLFFFGFFFIANFFKPLPNKSLIFCVNRNGSVQKLCYARQAAWQFTAGTNSNLSRLRKLFFFGLLISSIIFFFLSQQTVNSTFFSFLKFNSSQPKIYYILTFIFGWILVAFYFFIRFGFPALLFFIENIATKLSWIFLFALFWNVFFPALVSQAFPFFFLFLFYDLITINFIFNVTNNNKLIEPESTWKIFYTKLSVKRTNYLRAFFIALFILLIIFLIIFCSPNAWILLFIIPVVSIFLLIDFLQISKYFVFQFWCQKTASWFSKRYRKLPVKYRQEQIIKDLND